MSLARPTRLLSFSAERVPVFFEDRHRDLATSLAAGAALAIAEREAATDHARAAETVAAAVGELGL
jgi:hypothetical protein